MHQLWKSKYRSASLVVLVAACSGAQTGANLPNTPAQVPPARGGGGGGGGPIGVDGHALVRSDYSPGEITRLCNESMQHTQTRLDAVATLAPNARTIDNTLLELEDAVADLGDATTPLTFMAYVSRDAALREEGSKCEEAVGTFLVNVSTRKDLYDAVKDASPRDAEERRLLNETRRSFEDNGLQLPPDQLTQVRDLKGRLTQLEAQFAANLNNDTSTVTFRPALLSGVPERALARFKRDEQGNYIVTTKSTDYLAVMENATRGETRRQMLVAYLNRAATANTQLLGEATRVRLDIGRAMGKRTWAEYRLGSRMAGTPEAVLDFLNSLKSKLAQRNQSDLERLLNYKKAHVDQRATEVTAWDVNYLANQIKSRELSLDDDEIRSYFPSNVVMAGLFQVYSDLLGVDYVEVPNADVWSPDVKLYAIYERGQVSQPIAYFYGDFYPREGKYGHAAAFTLVQGRRVGSAYNVPVSAIVSNMDPPTNGKPSLLSHDEVETLFHEFGHIMHQTLTRAAYASLSGSSTARDFVEAPSQMLENWVWTPEVLNLLSGHADDNSRKLPAALREKMLAAKDFNQGYFYTRQLVFGLFDMAIHNSETPVDVDATYNRIYSEVQGLRPVEGTHFPASFGHMMGGYDAGYYGYLWSEVFAADMFTRFSQAAGSDPAGLLGPAAAAVGADYRHWILEKGSMLDASEILKGFLGRDPSPEAFFKKLGI